MPSPFPGMDPYLESPDHWGSVHSRINTAIEAQLNRNLPPGFVAELDQYVWLTGESDGDRELLGRPDTFVAAPRHPSTADDVGGGVAVAIEAAVAVEPTLETTLAKSRKVRRSYVKITTARGNEVLTVIELLSPSNKAPGPDRTAYLAKRSEYLAAGVNLLEIDLLRADAHLPAGRPLPPVTDYLIVLCPRDKPSKASVWAFGVRDSLPSIAVPFKAGIAPVILDLRACLDRAYDDGRYRDKLDYDGPCDPPLRQSDAEWAANWWSQRAKT